MPGIYGVENLIKIYHVCPELRCVHSMCDEGN